MSGDNAFGTWRLRAEKAEAEAAALKEAATQAIESMTATHYVLWTIRPDIEKIQGPDWLEVFNGMTEEKELLQNAIASLKTLPSTGAEAGQAPKEGR